MYIVDLHRRFTVDTKSFSALREVYALHEWLSEQVARELGRLILCIPKSLLVPCCRGCCFVFFGSDSETCLFSVGS